MSAHLIVRLNRQAFSNSVNDLLMLFDRLGWDWAPLERNHSGTVRLVHDRSGDSRDPDVPATDDDKAMKFIISPGPPDEIILLQGNLHGGIKSKERIGFYMTLGLGESRKEFGRYRLAGDDNTPSRMTYFSAQPGIYLNFDPERDLATAA